MSIELTMLCASVALLLVLVLIQANAGVVAQGLWPMAGNRDKVGWKLVGFPGVPASNYNDLIDEHNVPYRVEPVSILDIQQGRVKLDSQGLPKHVRLKDALGSNGR